MINILYQKNLFPASLFRKLLNLINQINKDILTLVMKLHHYNFCFNFLNEAVFFINKAFINKLIISENIYRLLIIIGPYYMLYYIG